MPELIPAKTEVRRKVYKNSLFIYHTLLFYVYAVKIRIRIISGPQSFYFIIIFFAIERNEEKSSKKCCESKYTYFYILYKLAIPIELEQEATSFKSWNGANF